MHGPLHVYASSVNALHAKRGDYDSIWITNELPAVVWSPIHQAPFALATSWSNCGYRLTSLPLRGGWSGNTATKVHKDVINGKEGYLRIIHVMISFPIYAMLRAKPTMRGRETRVLYARNHFKIASNCRNTNGVAKSYPSGIRKTPSPIQNSGAKEFDER